MSMPEDYLGYFFEHVDQSRPSAYVKLGREKQFLHGGGSLEAFGVKGSESGGLVEDQFSFLADLSMPLNEPCVLGSYQIHGGTLADIHILPAADGLWILFGFCESGTESILDSEQRVNASTEFSDAGESTSIALTGVLSFLSTLVLERVDEKRFRVVGQAPADFSEFYPELVDSPETLEPGERFSYLGNFLIDAERFWLKPAKGQLKSGIWSPRGVLDNELCLEATALTVEGRSILLIALMNLSSNDDQALIQAARVASLNHSRLLNEVQKKEDLLHCIVHDLKQPLSTMTGAFSFLDACSKEEWSKDAAEFIGMGMHASQQQNRMILDILDAFSSQAKGMESFEPAEADIPDLRNTLRFACEQQQAACSLRRVKAVTSIDCDSDGPLLVEAESSRLDRVVANLFENALRYSPPESTVTLSLSDEGDSILIRIEDEGPGVPTEVQPRLFEKFSQGGRKTGSTGLGLYFCRIMIERWGGEIGYQDRAEGGSSFRLRLKKFVSAAPTESGDSIVVAKQEHRA